MQFKTVLNGTPHELTLGFTTTYNLSVYGPLFLGEVVVNIFGVDDAFDRPAEYDVLSPVFSISCRRTCAVTVSLVDVSLGDRPDSLFHDALRRMHEVLDDIVNRRLPVGVKCQTRAIIRIDGGEIETEPGSGMKSAVIESVHWLGAGETVTPSHTGAGYSTTGGQPPFSPGQ